MSCFPASRIQRMLSLYCCRTRSGTVALISSSTVAAMLSVCTRSAGFPEVQTQRNGPKPREKMSLYTEDKVQTQQATDVKIILLPLFFQYQCTDEQQQYSSIREKQKYLHRAALMCKRTCRMLAIHPIICWTYEGYLNSVAPPPVFSTSAPGTGHITQHITKQLQQKERKTERKKSTSDEGKGGEKGGGGEEKRGKGVRKEEEQKVEEKKGRKRRRRKKRRRRGRRRRVRRK